MPNNLRAREHCEVDLVVADVGWQNRQLVLATLQFWDQMK
jgi:hypothetical protein